MTRSIGNVIQIPEKEIMNYMKWLASERKYSLVDMQHLYVHAFYDPRTYGKWDGNDFGKIHVGFARCHDIEEAAIALQLDIDRVELVLHPTIPCRIEVIPHRMIIPERPTAQDRLRHQFEKALYRNKSHED
jgi:hypothetical protein